MGNSMMRDSGKMVKFPIAVLLVFLFVFSFAASSHAAEKKAAKEAVVLMPMRATKDIPQDEMTQYEAALAKSLSERYVVYSGQRVLEKVNMVYKQRSAEAKAGKECDETKCLQDIAMEFQTALVAVANIRKSGGGYIISLSINDVTEDKSVFSNSVPCRGCDDFKMIEVLQTLAGGGAAPQPAIEKAPTPQAQPATSTPTPAPAPQGHFTDNGNGTVKDNVAELMWQQQDDGNERKWDDAMSYCKGLSLGGYSDWRLPSKDELMSFVKKGSNPAIYWSSSTYAYISAYARDTSSSDKSGYYYKINTNYVRCVRLGQ